MYGSLHAIWFRFTNSFGGFIVNKLLIASLMLFLSSTVFCMESTKVVMAKKREARIMDLQNVSNFNQYKSEVSRNFFDNNLLGNEKIYHAIKSGNYLLVVCSDLFDVDDDLDVIGECNGTLYKVIVINFDKNRVDREINGVLSFALSDDGSFFVFRQIRCRLFIFNCDRPESLKVISGFKKIHFVRNKNLVILMYNSDTAEVLLLEKFDKENKGSACKLISLKSFDSVKDFAVSSDGKILVIKRKNKFFLSECVFKCFEFETKFMDLENKFIIEKKICRSFKSEFKGNLPEVFELIKSNELLIKLNKSLSVLEVVEKNGVRHTFNDVKKIKTISGNHLLLSGKGEKKIINTDSFEVVREFKNIKKSSIICNYLIMLINPVKNVVNCQKDSACIIFDIDNNKIIENYARVKDYNKYLFLNKLFTVVSYLDKQNIVKILEPNCKMSKKIHIDNNCNLIAERVQDEQKEYGSVLYKLLEENKKIRENLLNKLTKKQFCDVRIKTCKSDSI